MSGRCGTSRFRGPDGSTYEVDSNTDHTKCAEHGCDVVLFWTDDGSDSAGNEFIAYNCECAQPCRACVEHRSRFTCELKYKNNRVPFTVVDSDDDDE